MGERAHSREAVCSMPITFVIMRRLSSGTRNQALKAEIRVLRMSLPGWLIM